MYLFLIQGLEDCGVGVVVVLTEVLDMLLEHYAWQKENRSSTAVQGKGSSVSLVQKIWACEQKESPVEGYLVLFPSGWVASIGRTSVSGE